MAIRFAADINAEQGTDLGWTFENGAQCRASSKEIELEVPMFELREAVLEEFPQVVDVEKFVENVLKLHSGDTYCMNHYYGDSVNYAYIKIKKDADLSRYL